MTGLCHRAVAGQVATPGVADPLRETRWLPFYSASSEKLPIQIDGVLYGATAIGRFDIDDVGIRHGADTVIEFHNI